MVGDTGDKGLILGREYAPEGGNGNLLQHSCLANSMGRRAWWASPWSTAGMEYVSDISL